MQQLKLSHYFFFRVCICGVGGAGKPLFTVIRVGKDPQTFKMHQPPLSPPLKISCSLLQTVSAGFGKHLGVQIWCKKSEHFITLVLHHTRTHCCILKVKVPSLRICFKKKEKRVHQCHLITESFKAGYELSEPNISMAVYCIKGL